MLIERRTKSTDGSVYVAYYFDGEPEFRALMKRRDKSDRDRAELDRLSRCIVTQAIELLDGYWADDDAAACDLFNLIGSYTAQAVYYWLKANASRLPRDVIATLRKEVSDVIMDCSVLMIQEKIHAYGRVAPLHGFIFSCVQNELWNRQKKIAANVVETDAVTARGESSDDFLDALIWRSSMPEMGMLNDFDGPSLKELLLGAVDGEWTFLSEAIADFEASRTQGDRIRRLTLIQLGVVLNCPHVVNGILLGRCGSYKDIANAGNPGSGGKPLDGQFLRFLGERLLNVYRGHAEFEAFREFIAGKDETLARVFEDPHAVGSAFLKLHVRVNGGLRNDV